MIQGLYHKENLDTERGRRTSSVDGKEKDVEFRQLLNVMVRTRDGSGTGTNPSLHLLQGCSHGGSKRFYQR